MEYVIEVKNYSGWIFGNSKNKYWTQTLPGRNGCEKRHFYNPIMQNEGHIRAIKRVLGDTSIPMYSIIVFSDQCVFKDLTYDYSAVNVIHRRNLRSVVSELEREYPNCIGCQQIDYISKLLLDSSVDGRAVRRAHIQNIKNK